MRLDSLEGEAREGATLRRSAVAWGVGGMGSIRVQALGRGPSVDMVRAGRRFVEEARLRIGGGEREAILRERGEEKGGAGRTRSGWERVRIVWPMEVGTVPMIGHFHISAPGNSIRDKFRQFMSSIRLITSPHVRISSAAHPSTSRHPCLSI